MPYRIDLADAGADLFDRLIEAGALDAEVRPGGGLAAVMPDTVTPGELRERLGVTGLSFAPAVSRDAGSVWIVSPRPFSAGGLRILPDTADQVPGALRLRDSAAFGTGRHPTTVMCLEALDELLRTDTPNAVLDVGTGSGVLALAALVMGVPRALGVDVDAEALRVAAENARLNGVEDRLTLMPGGPANVPGTWPLVLANVLAAPLIDMAPALGRRLGRHGHLVLSGIPSSLEREVSGAFKHLGMHHVRTTIRGGWVALVMRAGW